MSANSSIEWTDRTWNPVRGCSVISPGCVNCYAMKQAHRFSGAGKPYEGLTKQTKAGPQWTGVVRTVEDALLEPLSWRKPARIFVNSMSDLFHEDVPLPFIAEVFGVMAVAGALGTFQGDHDGYTEQKHDGKVIARWPKSLSGPHTFQVLTKRPERMRELLTSAKFRREVAAAAYRHAYNRVDAGYISHQIDSREEYGRCYQPGRLWPLPNVWLGVSVEDQKHARERIPSLLQTPAALRFISAEPLLGPLDLDSALWLDASAESPACLDWVIVGGESGSMLKSRPFDVEWARSLVQQCQDAGVPVFVKQIGSLPRIDNSPMLYMEHSKGGNPSEWPEDIRVRQFPDRRHV